MKAKPAGEMVDVPCRPDDPQDISGTSLWLTDPEEACAKLYLAAHVLFRVSLSRFGGSQVEPVEWQFRRGPYGRPEVPWPASGSLRFSLSRTNGLAACAIIRSEHVGIDVEQRDRSRDAAELVIDVLTARERGGKRMRPGAQCRPRAEPGRHYFKMRRMRAWRWMSAMGTWQAFPN